MAEVLAQFADPLVSRDGSKYKAQAVGKPNGAGLWEGWIEFLPMGTGAALRSPRETTQPNRTDAEYWANGLTRVYLEGALERAQNPLIKQMPLPARAIFDGPAPSITESTMPRSRQEAVLDPFSVYEKSERILRQELSALSAWHLVNIVLAYELSEEPASTLNQMTSAGLAELIVAGVRAHSTAR